MGIGLDYTEEIAPPALTAAGATVVFRYLSWLPNRKVIGAAEYARLVGAGLTVVLNWEFRATDWLGGAAVAIMHATEAVRQARALGYPSGHALIGSCDMDTWGPATQAYADAFRDTVHRGGYAAGVYGATDALDYCTAHGYGVLWQSMSTAFSRGANAHQHPRANYWQKGTRTVAGVSCDWSLIIDNPTPGDAMVMLATDGTHYYVCDGVTSRPIDPARIGDFVYAAGQGLCSLAHGTPGKEWVNATTRGGWSEEVFGKLVPNPSVPTNPPVEPSAHDVASEIIRQLIGTSG